MQPRSLLAAAVAAIEAYEGNLDEVVIDEYTPWSAGNAGLRASYDESMGEEAGDAVTLAAEAAQEELFIEDEPGAHRRCSAKKARLRARARVALPLP